MAHGSRTRPRKRPAQRRSRETVRAILDGAARVFEEHGYAAGTTNRIAERAGVSIGSLYEYFPNKDAIVVALAERELEKERAALLDVLEDGPERESLASLLRRFVEATLDLHAARPGLYRMLFEEADHPPRAHACVLRYEEALAHALESALRARGAGGDDPDTAAHLIVQTAESLAHRFVLRGIHDLDRVHFVEQVTRLLAGYARERRVAGSRRSPRSRAS
jgi:AcrR family transcriptional regulator